MQKFPMTVMNGSKETVSQKSEELADENKFIMLKDVRQLKVKSALLQFFFQYMSSKHAW